MEENVKKEEKQERRKYAPAGSRSGKMMSFRVDFDVVEILNQVKNKGRLLNELVRRWGSEHRGPQGPDSDISPDEDERDFYQP